MNEKPPLIDQPSAKPTRKVVAATVSGAAANILIVLVDRYAPTALDGIRAEVHVIASTIFPLVAGYFVRDRAW